MIRRRELFASAIAGVGFVSFGLARAQSPDPAPGLDPRLSARLELLGTFSRKTETLVAVYVARRTSSMLVEPLVTTGRLIYRHPELLVFRDDALTGSTTRIEGGRVSILPNQPSNPAADAKPPPSGPAIDPKAAPGLLWLRDRLLALFSSDDPELLLADSDASAPRGRKARIELRPRSGTLVRKVIRSVLVTLDPVGGAVLKVEIAEAQGDTYTLELSDHRQNVDEEEVDRLVAG